jgi:hypothetical protein
MNYKLMIKYATSVNKNNLKKEDLYIHAISQETILSHLC